jgi:hypothetical protein
MTNEQIAKVMGLKYDARRFKTFDFYNPKTNARYWSHSLEFAKLLQAKMVEDGWEITINVGKDRGWIEALRFDGDLYHRVGVDHQYHAAGNNEVLTEQQAIVSLFEKVYGGGR